MPDSGENNLPRYNGYLTREDRERLHGHKGAVIWFAGILAPYEPPEDSAMVIHSHQEKPMKSAQQILALIKRCEII